MSDLISRTDLLDMIINVPSGVLGKICNDKPELTKNEIMSIIEASAFRQDEIVELIKSMPTVEQKHGRWIEIDKDVTGLKRYECSNCGKTDDDYSEPIFCKHCGCAIRG